MGNLILWRIYNVITDHLGLDTVKNLFVNMALFVVIGVIIGVVWARTAPASLDATEPALAGTESPRIEEVG